MTAAMNELNLLAGKRPTIQTKKTATRVHFDTEVRIAAVVSSASCMTEKEKEELWYSTESLDAFKTEVRLLCRKLRDAPAEDDSENSRGLEHRICLIRQRNKQLALRCVLKAQMKSSCPDFLAGISLKCTAWASEQARKEATQDYCDAYHPHLPSLEPTDTIDSKREFEAVLEDQRNVRQRT